MSFDKKSYMKEYGKVWRSKNREHIKEYESKNIERRRGYCRKFYHQNKEYCWQRVLDWRKKSPLNASAIYRKNYIKNRPKRIEKSRSYYADNTGKISDSRRQYAKDNKSIINARQKEWYRLNPHIAKAGADKRRAVLIGATVGNVKVIAEWEKRWKELELVFCYWCLLPFNPKGCVSDHIVALKLGGSHSIGNLCISCSACNSSKHAKTLHEWNKTVRVPALAL